MAELLDTLLSPSMLELRYRFDASAIRLFQAWTEPEKLRQWFRVSPEYSTPIADVDLRIGGRFRLGMRTPEGEDIVAGGEYREVLEPDKLVFTWKWESAPPESPPTLVTLEFAQLDEGAEIILRHEHLPTIEQRDSHLDGWIGCMTNLFAIEKTLQEKQ